MTIQRYVQLLRRQAQNRSPRDIRDGAAPAPDRGRKLHPLITRTGVHISEFPVRPNHIVDGA